MSWLLVTTELSAEARSALVDECGYELLDRRGSDPATALADGAAAGCAGWILEGDRCGDEELSALPALRFVACVRGGPVNVDTAAATRRGITVIYTPGRNAEAVADFVIGQIIALVRYIAHTHHLLRSGALTEMRATTVRSRADVVWRPADPQALVPYHAFRGRELRTLTLGLLGLGRVGERVASKARALEMRVVAHDPFIDAATTTVQLVERAELFAASDVLSLHARGDRVLIGDSELQAMRHGAFLINTARGAILDHEALVAALRSGQLGGAALDVFPDEPLTPGDPLLELDNVVLTPHIAGASLNVVDHYSHSLITALRALREGGDLRGAAVANAETLAGWTPGKEHAP
ncbi:MAG: D-3-phosphoglycerate dehydrogenase / 2-oxoglutarate reductase [Gaiellales bacterium]|jgi:D-3-phosphoglycerate dehydrogenase|nr:D-3-phosphoglycerate dehydrogenase / 2-oxoglutarate reductase [Gaiellales bacterium]